MDTEKPLPQKETSSLKTRTERLPAIEAKNGEEKLPFKKSVNTLLKPKLNFPKLKADEIPQQRVEAGEPGVSSTEFLIGKTKTLSTATFKVADFSQSKLLAFGAQQKVIGISKCEVGFKVPSSEFSFSNDPEIEEEDLEESNALKRWKYWVKDKMHMQKVLSKKLGRNPCDLQIQVSDKCRAIHEDKLLLTYAQIPKPDKWRGHPFFWKQKPRMGQRNDPENCGVPEYIAAETKVDTGCLPEVEFIGIPEIIQKEKDLICNTENISLEKWKKMPYRKEQINRFKEQRKKMKPHNILMDDLAVFGVKITEKEESKESIKAQCIPEIIVTEENSNCLDFRQSIFCLVIDGGEIKYELGTENCQNPDKVFTWQVNFGTNKIGSLVEKILRIENRGTMAVAYDWISKKNDQKGNLGLLQRKLHEPCFFFNKNSGLFLPGQIYDLKFYHRSEFTGFRKEMWYLRTKPPLSQNQEMGSIVLSAVATEDLSCEKEAVNLFLRNRVRDTVVRFAIEVIFYKVFNPSEGLCGIEYRSFFNEKELFEYHNPKHYYHSTIVKELNELFDEIPLKNQTEWDFCLRSFVTVIKTSGTNEEKNSLLQKLAIRSRQLFRPNYLHVKKLNNRKMAFEILSKMVTLIEEDYKYIRNLFFQNKEHTSSLSSKSEETSEEEFNGTLALFELKTVEFILFQTIIHAKVHQRLCEAVESIVGMIETNKLLKPWKQGPEVVKPSRRKLHMQTQMRMNELMTAGAKCKREV